MKTTVTLLNTSILTEYGHYKYAQVTLKILLSYLEGKEIQSAVGHESTAQILTKLLGQDIPVNRVQYKQGKGDIAIIFKLNGRSEEGKILTAEEIEEIGYEFGLLTRIQ
jgi:hypothetical protein